MTTGNSIEVSLLDLHCQDPLQAYGTATIVVDESMNGEMVSSAEAPKVEKMERLTRKLNVSVFHVTYMMSSHLE